jgi:hypothetical protein
MLILHVPALPLKAIDKQELQLPLADLARQLRLHAKVHRFTLDRVQVVHRITKRIPIKLLRLRLLAGRVHHLRAVIARQADQVRHLRTVIARQAGQVHHLRVITARQAGQAHHLRAVTVRQAGQAHRVALRADRQAAVVLLVRAAAHVEDN